MRSKYFSELALVASSCSLISAAMLFTGCGAVRTQENIVRKQRQDLDGVYRAGKAIESALQVGSDYKQFGVLVQNLASEISIARDRMQTMSEGKFGEEKILNQYGDALEFYEDSQKVWTYSLSLPLVGKDVAAKNNPEVGRILQKYGQLSMLASDPRVLSEFPETLRQVGTENLRSANAMLLGMPVSGSAPSSIR